MAARISQELRALLPPSRRHASANGLSKPALQSGGAVRRAAAVGGRDCHRQSRIPRSYPMSNFGLAIRLAAAALGFAVLAIAPAPAQQRTTTPPPPTTRSIEQQQNKNFNAQQQQKLKDAAKERALTGGADQAKQATKGMKAKPKEDQLSKSAAQSQKSIGYKKKLQACQVGCAIKNPSKGPPKSVDIMGAKVATGPSETTFSATKQCVDSCMAK
jgi:hypothetical protein